MKAATSAHDLKGISFIGDLYVLIGIGLILTGILFLFILNLSGLLFIGLGLFVGAIGHYLDDLEPWAWWGAFLGNFGSAGGIIYVIAGSPLEITIRLVYFLSGAALTIAIFIYLLRPSVRDLFFQK